MRCSVGKHSANSKCYINTLGLQVWGARVQVFEHLLPHGCNSLGGDRLGKGTREFNLGAVVGLGHLVTAFQTIAWSQKASKAQAQEIPMVAVLQGIARYNQWSMQRNVYCECNINDFQMNTNPLRCLVSSEPWKGGVFNVKLNQWKSTTTRGKDDRHRQILGSHLWRGLMSALSVKITLQLVLV